LKSAGAILFLVAFFAQSFNQSFVVFGFYANRSFYARICENKTRPVLHCNGKCQLAKKLKQEEGKDQQNSQRKLETKNEVIFCSNLPCGLSFFPIAKNRYFNYSEKLIISFSLPVFHPPSV
jgi:hypothetical protein